MADPTYKIESAPIPIYKNSDTAPFVYFDMAPTYGIMNGAVQIELLARTLIPKSEGGVQIEFGITGRLRCTPAAARDLRNALDAALKLFDQAPEVPVAASKMN